MAGMREPVTLTTDVLVIGAGGASMYAAVSAARDGAKVLLIDKNVVGRGGATIMAQMNVRVGPRRGGAGFARIASRRSIRCRRRRSCRHRYADEEGTPVAAAFCLWLPSDRAAIAVTPVWPGAKFGGKLKRFEAWDAAGRLTATDVYHSAKMNSLRTVT